MAMTIKDFRQLEKLMLLTTSDSDHEALAALRKANGLLQRYGYTWASAFKRLVKVEEPLSGYEDVSAEPEPSTIAGARRRADGALLDEAESLDPRGRDADFVSSLREGFERHGSLTECQASALRDVAERLRR